MASTTALGINSTATVKGNDSQGAPATDEKAGGGEATSFFNRSRPIVEEPWFNGIVGSVVLINCATIGIETDYGDGDLKEFFVVLNNGFLIFYLGELLLRLFTFGFAALRDRMTAFDAFLVLAAFAERTAADSDLTKALPSLRLLRLARLLRATKILRASQQLMVLLDSFSRVLNTLFWMVCCLTVMLWCAAVAAYMAVGGSDDFETAVDPFDTSGDPLKQFNNHEYFGSMSRSFYSLFQIVTLSQWSDHMARPILEVYPVSAVFFLTLTLITSYSLMMGVAANVVQDSLMHSRSNEIAMKERQREQRMEKARYCQALFLAGDVDGSGELDVAELEEALMNDDIVAALEALEVPRRVFNAEALVAMLDFDGNGTVSYEELLEGVVKLDDDIAQKDYTLLAMRLNNLMMRAATLDRQLHDVSQNVHRVRMKMEGALQALHQFLKTANATTVFQRARKQLREARPYEPPPPMQPIKKAKTGTTIPVKSAGEEFMAFTKRMFGGGKMSPQSLAKIALRPALPVRPSAGGRLSTGKRPTAANKLFAQLQAATEAAAAAMTAEAELAKSQPPPATDAWLTETPKAAGATNPQLRQAARQSVTSKLVDLTMSRSSTPKPKDAYAMSGLDVNPRLREVQLQIAEPELSSPTSPKAKKKGKGKILPSPVSRQP